jgi:predicted negative regulator of RcsB-dependent stress response
MVEEYLTDDEQGEALKTWWRENWAWVLSGIAIGLCLLGGWQYYQSFKIQRAETAAEVLDQFSEAQVNDKAKADTLLNEFTDKYAATPYAMQARLLQVQHAVNSNDLAAAETALRAVIADSKDAELAQVAKLRLARVLIEQGKADEALTLLDTAKAGAFVAQVHEIRGDALYAKQDQNGARGEYEAALAAFKSDTGADVTLLELKLSDLGGTIAAATTATDASKVSAQ